MRVSEAGMRFHHVGVAVKSIQSSSRLYELLGIASGWTECVQDHINNVAVCFGNVAEDGPTVELVEPIEKGSPVEGMLARTGGMSTPYHVAYTVESLDDAMAAMRHAGALQVTPVRAARAFGDNRIVFFALPDGLVVELIENCGHGGEKTDEPARDHPAQSADC